MEQLQRIESRLSEIKELKDEITALEIKDKNNRAMVDALRVKMKSEIDAIYKVLGEMSAELGK